MAVNKKNHVAAELKQQVLTLALKPGSALDETRLAEEYGLSRTPLREVLQRLAGEGYLSLENNRGATVSSMDLGTMRSFFQTAPMIYAAIARLAAEQATVKQITALKDTQHRLTLAVDKNVVADMVLHNHRFHEITGEMAASQYLAPSLGRLLIDHTRMSHRFYSVQQQESRARVIESCQQHDAMIEAIENREAALAVDLTLQHWALSRDEMEKYVSPDPLPNDAASFEQQTRSPQSVEVFS